MRSTEAALRQAEETVNEVQATLDWATIRSPIDGTVVDKKVDVGDMVTPGQMLATLYDPTRMQLVASVRESLTHRLQVGQDVSVRIEGLDKQCRGTVSEIVPEAQSASRTFQVKVTGPCPPGIYSGMFGRILIPLQEEQVLVVPLPRCAGSANSSWCRWRKTAERWCGRSARGGPWVRTSRCSRACAKGNRSYWSQPRTTRRRQRHD